MRARQAAVDRLQDRLTEVRRAARSGRGPEFWRTLEAGLSVSLSVVGYPARAPEASASRTLEVTLRGLHGVLRSVREVSIPRAHTICVGAWRLYRDYA